MHLESAEMKKIFLFVALQGILFLSVAQNVNKVFETLKWDEQFKNIQGVWSQTSTAQNAFLQSPEGYNVWRKNESNGFFILPKNDLTFDFFEAELSFSFDKNVGKKQFGGIVLQAQEGGAGAILIELNRKKQFRVRRVSNNRISNVSDGNDGWVKSKKIKGNSTFVLKVVTKDRLYDVYVNGIFIYTFTEIEFTEGKIGIYIGQKSRANFTSLRVKSDDDMDVFSSKMSKSQDEILNETIVKLRESINKKDQRIASIEADLRKYKNAPKEDSTQLKEFIRLKKQNKKNSNFIRDLETENESLALKLKKLETFKKEITDNESGDIIINLSNLTTAQKLKIEEQESTIRLQNESIEKLKNRNYENAKTISFLELQNVRSETQTQDYQQNLKKVDSLNSELKYQIVDLEAELEKLIKAKSMKQEKSDKKSKRKKKKKEELPEFIIEE